VIELLPPCTNACPVHTDVRGYLAAISRRDYLEAYNLIRANNPFPSVCAWICSHPCESACRRAQVDAPLSIRNLKRFAVDAVGLRAEKVNPAGFTGKKVAIVGSGPAGLTAAFDLARLGHRVTVYDRYREPGGHFLASLPTFRLPREILRRDVEQILSAGVDFIPETEVGKDIKIDELGKIYNAVIICTGLWGGRGVAMPGFDHPDILFALPFLKLANLGENPRIGKRVAVIGGGNVAMDVARTALRLGAPEVTVICLEKREEMPASVWDIAEALAEGVIIEHGYGPVEVLSNGSKITGIKVQKVKTVLDWEGKFNPVYEPNIYKTIPSDTVILSIGQTPETSFLEGSSLITDALGYLLIDKNSLSTSATGIFACGEIVTGPGQAIAAVASGHRVAGIVDHYLRGEKKLPVERELKLIGALPAEVAEKVPQFERQEMPSLSPEQRSINFLPYELGLGENEALREVGRCMNCGLGAKVDAEKCVACLTCRRVCPYSVPVVEERAVISVEGCLACGICAAACPAGAITMEVINESAIKKSLCVSMEIINSPIERYLVLFVCRGACTDNSIQDSLKESSTLMKTRLVEIPTAGALRLEWILDAFEDGAAGVVIVACGSGQCRHPSGSVSAGGVVRRAKTLLVQLGINPERLCYCQLGEGEDIIEILDNYTMKLSDFI